MLLPIPDVLTAEQVSHAAQVLDEPTGSMAKSPPAINPPRPKTICSFPEVSPPRGNWAR